MIALQIFKTIDDEFDLSLLRDFLGETLRVTERVKNILRINCEEAAHSLKPWHVETIIRKEITEDMCICRKETTSEDYVTDIATGISRALLQSQLLREKLSTNVAKGKRIANAPSTSDIYTQSLALSSKSSKTNTRVMEETTKMRRDTKCDTVNSGETKASEIVKNKSKKLEKEVKEKNKSSSITNSPLKKRTIVTNVKSNTAKCTNLTKKSVSRQVEKEVPSGSTKKAAKAKNFLAINKLTVKKAGQTDAQKKSTSNLSCKTVAVQTKPLFVEKKYSAASTNELQNLIKVMSVQSSSTPSTMSNETDSDCPVHGRSLLKHIEERSSISMDAVEGLDRFNIPGEIIKTLKAYQSHLSNGIFYASIRNKQEKAPHRFLIELDKANKNARECLFHDSAINTTIKNAVSLFGAIARNTANLTFTEDIKKLRMELNTLYQQYNINIFDITQFRTLNTIHAFTRINRVCDGWIWNPLALNNFEGNFGLSCISYLDKNQLLTFFRELQDLQEVQCLNTVIQILLHYVIPSLKTHFDPTQKEHIQIYKMVHILHQGLNPIIPVLVKTDV